jgi:hypothetical protein
VDNISRIILDVLFKKEVLPTSLNVVHPKPIPWTYMINTVNHALQKNNVCPKLALVSWAEWMSKVEKFGSGRLDQDLLQSLPAIKILTFFQGLSVHAGNGNATSDVMVEFPKFLTDTACKTSKTLCNMDPLTHTDIERWIDLWHLKGFF